MHSSRMHTARSSGRPWVVSTRHPSQEQATQQEQAPPPEQASPPRAGTPLGADPQSRHPRTSHPPPCGQTHACKHITLPKTSFAGGKYILLHFKFARKTSLKKSLSYHSGHILVVMFDLYYFLKKKKSQK